MRYARTWQFLAALGALGFGAANGCGGATTPVGSLNAPVDGQTCGPAGSSGDAADGCNTCVCASNGHWACTKKACGGTGSGTGTGSATGTGSSTGTGSTGTGAVCQDGEIKMAPDGCNTCTCSGGGWACTLIGCPTPVCKDGETKMAPDGCNSCTCSGGGWACTEKGCPDPVCKDGETKIAPDGCNSCGCIGGQWACTAKGCPTPACKDGESMQADCNTCKCAGGQWACTDIACPVPECKPGDTKMIDCNKCACSTDGRWGCTLIACGEPKCPPPVASDLVCPPIIIYAKDPVSGICCEYGPCNAPAGWKQFRSPDECAKP